MRSLLDLDQPTWPNGRTRPSQAPSKTWLKAKNPASDVVPGRARTGAKARGPDRLIHRLIFRAAASIYTNAGQWGLGSMDTGKKRAPWVPTRIEPPDPLAPLEEWLRQRQSGCAGGPAARQPSRSGPTTTLSIHNTSDERASGAAPAAAFRSSPKKGAQGCYINRRRWLTFVSGTLSKSLVTCRCRSAGFQCAMHMLTRRR